MMDLSEDKEQLIADFMCCTGVDDFNECLMHLNRANWNLLAAINNVMPEESQTLPSEREMELPMELTEVASLPVSVGINSHPLPENRQHSASGDPLHSEDLVCLGDRPSHVLHRLLNFSVHYKERVVPLEVPESETIASIKTALHAELGIPVCRQELCGWRRNHITDDTLLSSLQLPQLTDLFLYAKDPMNLASVIGADTLTYSDRLEMKYRLHIIDMTNSKEYDLHFPGSKSVLDVKLGVRDITNIPVRFQHWTGWPDVLKEENAKLASLELQNSPLELVLSREESKGKKQCVVDLTSSESSDNEFEEAAECFGVDDDMFQSTISSRKIQPLIPEGCDNEAVAASNFEKEFASRYGTCHPPFQTSVTEALQNSCLKSAKERRPLAIYLHHDASVLTNVFCAQLLCSETVVSYMALNFVTWAWDLTFESNKTFLLALITQNLGLAAANTIKNMALDNLPALIIFTKVRSMPEVLTVIPGNVGLDDLMTRLIHSVEVFNSEMTSEIREEDEREAREMVKREQDAAYEASLLADRAKEEARRQETKVKEKLEKEETEQKEMIQQMQQMEEAMTHAIRISLAEQLPPEPPVDSPSPISHIKVWLPNGVTIARRFAADTPLSLLLIYLASEGYPKEKYKVLGSWPRRDLTTLEEGKTLEELQLYPKETLTLEER